MKVYNKEDLSWKLDYSSLDNLISSFKKVMFKKIKYYERIQDFGSRYLSDYITKNTDKNFVCNFSSSDVEFFNSNFISAYMKKLMIRYINIDGTIDLDGAAKKVILSKKTFNEMTAEEIQTVLVGLGLKHGYNYVPYLFMKYIYMLNGQGAREYLANLANKRDVVDEFLSTAGMSTRSEWYATCGVNSCYLSEKNLVSIYSKFFKINASYAVEFFKLVCSIRELNGSEFVENIHRFAKNEFKHDGYIITDSRNQTIEADTDAEKTSNACVRLISEFKYGDDEEEVRKTNQMKYYFIKGVLGSLADVDPQLCAVSAESLRAYEENTNLFRTRY